MRQPERSEAGAKDRYLSVLRRSIHCVNPNVDVRLGPLGGPNYSLVTGERPIPLTRGQYADRPLFLTVEQSIELIPHPEFAGDFKLPARSYYYGVYETDQVDTTYPIISWHWQPNDPHWPNPHLHAPLPNGLGRRNVGGKLHVPTGGRVKVEEVIRFLIEEGLAAPTDPDWDAKLRDAQARVDAFASN